MNKSLFHLKSIMKKVADLQNSCDEEVTTKHISFRDSKLTRILQASLGGNTLASIICTIRPSVLCESQSTISFGLTANAIKIKPSGYEMLYRDTVMKRVNGEIEDLKYQLNQEQRKSNHFKVSEIERSIKRESMKIISSTSLTDKRHQKRRRTPSLTSIDSTNDTDSVAEDIALSRPTRHSQIQIPIPNLSRIPSRFTFATPTCRHQAPAGTKDKGKDGSAKVEDKAKVKTPTREPKAPKK